MARQRTAASQSNRQDNDVLEPAGGRWLTIQEACAYLGVDQSTLRRWSDRGKYPFFALLEATAATPRPI